ncbi:MAG: metallophosphoesterase family protein [Candidatus Latescibacterota bacterium]|nr:metallophosphoesterase family protein [Candidatus Latescibacterota bacterium]
MKITILSDIHANLEALETVMIESERSGISRFISLGDVVGYGPDPVACINRLRDVKATLIAGNHDLALLNKNEIRLFNAFVRPSLFYAVEVVGKQELDYLGSQSLVYHGKNELNIGVFAHANPRDPIQMLPLYLAESIEDYMQLVENKITFVGHTHAPSIFCKIRNRVQTLTSSMFAIGPHKYLVNPGSVGQPRDGDSRASYAIWDTDQNNIEIKRTEYPFQKTQEKMHEVGFPIYTIERLASGE